MTDTPEIAAIRELFAARKEYTINYAEYRLGAAWTAIRAILAAHDERESAPSVDVRIPVGVAPNGDFYAAGWNGGEDGSPELHIRDEMGAAVTIHTITARVPLSQTIKGRVEQ